MTASVAPQPSDRFVLTDEEYRRIRGLEAIGVALEAACKAGLSPERWAVVAANEAAGVKTVLEVA